MRVKQLKGEGANVAGSPGGEDLGSSGPPTPESRLDTPSLLERRVSLKTAHVGLLALVGAGALVVAALVVLGGDDNGEDAEAVAASTTTASVALAETTAITAAEVTDEVVLLPDGLGVVDFGASPEHTIAALTEVLGIPDFTQEHGGPEAFPVAYRCVGSARPTGIVQAVWGERLVVLASEHSGFFAWRFVTAGNFIGTGERLDSDLATPEGLGTGTTVEDFEREYGPTTTSVDTLTGELDYLGEGPAEFDHLVSPTGYDAAAFQGNLSFFGATGDDPARVCTMLGGHA